MARLTPQEIWEQTMGGASQSLPLKGQPLRKRDDSEIYGSPQRSSGATASATGAPMPQGSDLNPVQEYDQQMQQQRLENPSLIQRGWDVAKALGKGVLGQAGYEGAQKLSLYLKFPELKKAREGAISAKLQEGEQLAKLIQNPNITPDEKVEYSTRLKELTMQVEKDREEINVVPETEGFWATSGVKRLVQDSSAQQGKVGSAAPEETNMVQKPTGMQALAGGAQAALQVAGGPLAQKAAKGMTWVARALKVTGPLAAASSGTYGLMQGKSVKEAAKDAVVGYGFGVGLEALARGMSVAAGKVRDRLFTPKEVRTVLGSERGADFSKTQKNGVAEAKEYLDYALKTKGDVGQQNLWTRTGEEMGDAADDLLARQRTEIWNKMDDYMSSSAGVKPVKGAGNTAIKYFNDLIDDRLGVRIDVDDAGKIFVAPSGAGRGQILDPSEYKDVLGYYKRLSSLGSDPTRKALSDVSRGMQASLYGPREPGVARNSIVEGIGKQVEHKVREVFTNSLPKNSVYSKLNQESGVISGLLDDIAQSGGDEGVRNGNVVRALFSPNPENSRRILTKLSELTGKDFVRKAVLSKWAMELVGDPRGPMLLEQMQKLIPGGGRWMQAIVDAFLSDESMAKFMTKIGKQSVEAISRGGR